MRIGKIKIWHLRFWSIKRRKSDLQDHNYLRRPLMMKDISRRLIWTGCFIGFRSIKKRNIKKKVKVGNLINLTKVLIWVRSKMVSLRKLRII